MTAEQRPDFLVPPAAGHPPVDPWSAFPAPGQREAGWPEPYPADGRSGPPSGPPIQRPAGQATASGQVPAYLGQFGPAGPVSARGYGPPVPVAGPEPKNGLGIASLALGVAAAVLGPTFYLSPAGFVLGVLALVLGVTGARRAGRGQATHRAVALGGLWTGAGAALVSGVLTALLLVWLTTYVEVESGAGAAYLAGAGEPVHFEDGLTITFQEATAEGDTMLRVTAELHNDGTTEAALTGGELFGYADGEDLEAGAIERTGAEPGTVAPGETSAVAYRVTVPSTARALGLDYAPGRGHGFAYWELPVPGAPQDGEDTEV